MRSPKPDASVALRVDWADTRALCARVGPTAFALLLELAATSEKRGRWLSSAGSLRGLAARTGLGKDTVSRHLRRLEAAGIIQRVDTNNVFEPTEYRLHLAGTGITRTRLRVQAQQHRGTSNRSSAVQYALPFASDVDLP